MTFSIAMSDSPASLCCIMVDLRYVFISLSVEHEHSPLAMVIGIVSEILNALTTFGIASQRPLETVNSSTFRGVGEIMDDMVQCFKFCKQS